mmetsp:Transcript_3436/g.9956  ORF Transcript_3436/g.9956 Transcript_3436/m.9956 type:complete len:164 (-) Transcript_3436:2154-2645(-)
MQRRVLGSMAANLVREFRARASLSQEPAAFRALHANGGAFAGIHDGTAATPPQSDAAPREPEARLGLMFTCNKCDTRAMRSFSKAAYQSGVVIVKCANDDCGSRHLIADHLGWFGAKGRTVEDMMRDKGQEVRWQGDGETLELSAADAQAWSKASTDSSAVRP